MLHKDVIQEVNKMNPNNKTSYKRCPLPQKTKKGATDFFSVPADTQSEYYPKD